MNKPMILLQMQGEALVMGYDEMGWADSKISVLTESDTMAYGFLLKHCFLGTSFGSLI